MGSVLDVPSIRHSLTISHNRFMSPSLKYLHFFAISSHSSGPPPEVGAGPPKSEIDIFSGAGVGAGAEGWDVDETKLSGVRGELEEVSRMRGGRGGILAGLRERAVGGSKGASGALSESILGV